MSQIHILNAACMIGFSLSLISSISSIFLNNSATPINLAISFTFVIILILQNYRLYTFSKFLVYYPCLFFITAIAIRNVFISPNYVNEFSIIPFSMIGIIIYSGIQKKIAFSLAIVNVSIIEIIKIKIWHLNISHILFTNILILVGTFISIYYVTINYKNGFKALVQKNQELTDQREIIASQSEKLQAVNQLKDKLFSIISHDLRSPFSQLSGTLELINEKIFTETDLSEILPQISKNTNELSKLLDNILHWSRNQLAGNLTLPQAFDLTLSIESISSLFAPSIQKKGIHYTNDGQNQMMVFADKNMIELVLRNLLYNAIKFCQNDAKITILCSELPTYIQVCVSDTGVGISEERQKTLFQNELVSTKGTSNESGTGLGLLLCKEFVEKNNGEIWVKSILGEGSKFCFTIPKVNNR
ncbi:MAG: HAMP domain-containing sensor histidine kinase [Bacteroidota bacterium]